jgi:hypothetical protein
MRRVLSAVVLGTLLLGSATTAAAGEDEPFSTPAQEGIHSLGSEALQGLSLLTGDTAPPGPGTELTLGPSEEAPSGPDWAGLGRDTLFLFGYQVAMIGILYVLPESVSNWDEEQKKDIGNRWVKHVQNPQWDSDSWFMNYVAHPYFGATYYIRSRERGFDEFSSFVYSAFASALYEFGVEALFEEPSIQDLIVTPVGGVLVGKFIFEPVRNRIKAKPEPRWYDHVALALTDPIGALNGVFERWLGIKSDVRISVKPPQSGSRESRVNVRLSVAW